MSCLDQIDRPWSPSGFSHLSKPWWFERKHLGMILSSGRKPQIFPFFPTSLACRPSKKWSMPRLSFSPDGSFLVAAGLDVVGETQATATTTGLAVIIWIYPAPRMLVTTKIIAFLIGNRNPKPSFGWNPWWGRSKS